MAIALLNYANYAEWNASMQKSIQTKNGTVQMPLIILDKIRINTVAIYNTEAE